MASIGALIDGTYERFEGSELLMDYSARHDIDAAQILTVTDDDTAATIAHHLRPRIEGKVVVEIGAGIGLLAIHMADYAKRVYAIEASPPWATVFMMTLLFKKPKNCTFILGAASEVSDSIAADVALFCTHSDAAGMRKECEAFAPVVIDVYGEVIKTMKDPCDDVLLAIREGVNV